MFGSSVLSPITHYFVSKPVFIFLPTTTNRLIKLRRYYCKCTQMASNDSSDQLMNKSCSQEANFRLCNVSGYKTEVLEIQATNPTLHVLFIPGNPGIVTFYKDFVESLYEEVGGNVSITAIGHIGHTSKNWEQGRLFTLEEQVDHKMDFIAQEYQNKNTPIILVGHSIGSYISLEVFKRTEHKVIYCIGLYPFLALNTKSTMQTPIRKLAEIPVLCSLVSSIVALLGVLPSWSRFIVKNTLGKSWSETAVDAASSHLVKYHTMRNMLLMTMTEFQKFSEAPDWELLRPKQREIAFLFGIDDHWGPLSLFEEIAKQAPEVDLSIEKEGHDHAFSCTEAGSVWVAQHVANLIKKCTSTM